MPPPLPQGRPHDPSPHPIDYRSADMAAPRRPIVDVPLLCVGVLFAGVVSVLTVYVTPRLEAVFRDLGVKLPEMTIQVLRFSRLCARGGLGAVWLLMLAPSFLVPLMTPWPPADPGRRHGRLGRTLVILLLAMFTAWLAVGLFLPYVSLVDAISGPAPKR